MSATNQNPGTSMKTVSAATVGRELVALAKAEDRQLTPLEVMKLVYISHGWHLGYLSQSLLTEEVEAWQYGPVVPDLYQKLKQYRASPVLAIPEDASDFTDKLDSNQKALIKSVYNSYKHLRGIQLSSLTHQPGTPWSVTWEKHGKNATIPTSLISQHYKELVQKVSGKQ